MVRHKGCVARACIPPCGNIICDFASIGSIDWEIYDGKIAPDLLYLVFDDS